MAGDGDARPSQLRKEAVMFELKSLSADAIPAALAKAERYRLLNEPEEAESICLDVLAVDQTNQAALVMLLLALTDQFRHGPGDLPNRARDVLPRLVGEYARAYYAGIICERRARAALERGLPASGATAYELLREAMDAYDRAATLRPAGNDDAFLRWNTCVRLLRRHPHLRPRDDAYEPQLLE
jgi:hypothetical protein